MGTNLSGASWPIRLDPGDSRRLRGGVAILSRSSTTREGTFLARPWKDGHSAFGRSREKRAPRLTSLTDRNLAP